MTRKPCPYINECTGYHFCVEHRTEYVFEDGLKFTLYSCEKTNDLTQLEKEPGYITAREKRKYDKV